MFVDDSTSHDSLGVLNMSYAYLKVIAFAFIPATFTTIFRPSIQSMNHANIAMCSGTLELIARSSFGIILVPLLGFSAVIWADAAAWIVADLFLIPTWCYFLHKKRIRIFCR